MKRTMQGMLMTGVLAAGALGMAGVAQARSDVYWSIGMGSPGVSVGVSNAPPVYYAPQPVYVQPAPVYVRPRPVYVAPPAYYAPPRVMVRPQPVYYYGPPGHYKHQKKWRKKHRHHGDWD
ncbi:MAG: hypothetical protein IPG98_05245 [Burkholderiales bacterium]|nr:hypothetical protein [Burkholderiales bacterium]MBK8666325.1 hypothetical protein [Burkholderiales bacterium]